MQFVATYTRYGVLLSCLRSLTHYHRAYYGLSELARWFSSSVGAEATAYCKSELERVEQQFRWGQLEHRFHRSKTTPELLNNIATIDNPCIREALVRILAVVDQQFTMDFDSMVEDLDKQKNWIEQDVQNLQWADTLAVLEKMYGPVPGGECLISLVPLCASSKVKSSVAYGKVPLVIIHMSHPWDGARNMLIRTLLHAVTHILLRSTDNPTHHLEAIDPETADVVREVLVQLGFPSGKLAYDLGYASAISPRITRVMDLLRIDRSTSATAAITIEEIIRNIMRIIRLQGKSTFTNSFQISSQPPLGQSFKKPSRSKDLSRP